MKTVWVNVTEGSVPLFSDLDIYFGLPKEENDRAARVYDMPFLCLDTMLAVRYWPIMWTVLTQPESVARRSITNPSGVSY